MEHKVEATTGEPAIGISCQIQLDRAGTRTLVIQTHVPQSATREEINKIVDTAMAVGNRQSDSVHAFDMEDSLVTHRKTLANSKSDLNRIDNRHREEWENRGRRGELKLTPAEQTNRSNVITNVGKLEEEIKWFEERIAALRDKVKTDAY